MNRIQLIGYLANEHNYKLTNGIAFLKNTLAVKRDFKNKAGGYDTDFIEFYAFRSDAEYLHNYTHKGDMILLQGRVQMNTKTRQDNSTYQVLEVMVDSVEILKSKPVEEPKEPELDISNLPF